MEVEKCLFILTNDLAAYLFNDNTETNKTKNKLYVALTRSLNELSIYILKEVEDKYTKEKIQGFLKNIFQSEEGNLFYREKRKDYCKR